MPAVTAQAPLPQTISASTVADSAMVGVPRETSATPEVAAAEEPKKEGALSPKLAELARRERELRRIQKEIQDEKAAIKAKEEDYRTNYIPKSQLTANPYQTLLDNGYSHEQIQMMSLSAPTPQDQAYQKLQQEIAALKSETELNKKAYQENQTKGYQQALNQIRNQVSELVENNPEFEMIKHLNSTDDVVKRIEDEYQKNGTILKNDDAARLVEKELEEAAELFLSIPKIKAKMQPTAPAVPEKKTFQEAVKQTPPMKTITNAALSVPSSASSSKQRRERAIAAMTGQL